MYREAAQVKSLIKPLGLYIHIPFCRHKCAYCDFYTAVLSDTVLDRFADSLIDEIRKWGGCIDRPIDTVYIGGGTPSVLGSRIKDILSAVRESFTVCDDAEITAEMNPENDLTEFLNAAKESGVNRLSIGVQSANDNELKTLGRLHTPSDAERAVAQARKTGFDNISLDIMLGLPESNLKTLKKSIDFICGLAPEHISAYMLSIEKNTKLAISTLNLPDEDRQAKQYLYTCDELENHGYFHYEISNFALSGKESRHNLKYWNCEEYLGIGPAAHSFLDGKRFFYSRDLKAFLCGTKPNDDGLGGTPEERLMLGLRLKKGVELNTEDNKNLLDFINTLEKEKLAVYKDRRLSLTDKGMLLSNGIITEITELLYENI